MAAELSPVMATVTDEFDRLLAEHAPRVYGFVCRLVGPDAADDVAQEVWIAIYRALPRFRGDSRVTTWMFSIATRVSQRHRRRYRRSLPPADEAAAEAVIDLAAGPETRALGGELAKVVKQAIDRLPDGQREALHLRQIEGCSYQEIADILGVPVGTVRSRLHHGTAHLADLLRPYLEGDDDPA